MGMAPGPHSFWCPMGSLGGNELCSYVPTMHIFECKISLLFKLKRLSKHHSYLLTKWLEKHSRTVRAKNWSNISGGQFGNMYPKALTIQRLT